MLPLVFMFSICSCFMNVQKKKHSGVFLWHITGPLSSVLKNSLTVKLFLYFLHKPSTHVKQKIDFYSHVNINDTPSIALQLFKGLGENWLQSWEVDMQVTQLLCFRSMFLGGTFKSVKNKKQKPSIPSSPENVKWMYFYHICQRLSLIFNILFAVSVCINKAVLCFNSSQHWFYVVMLNKTQSSIKCTLQCTHTRCFPLVNVTSFATNCCFVEFVYNVKTILQCI